ncbi:RNA polymerase sigma factor [Evansella sp. AB-rgal1]|uniref:RNA polymerase sigma factor n=1 Tax=Evansella sp. AB-rgal1 TaxID=3242696 RepID=UPI00359E0433
MNNDMNKHKINAWYDEYSNDIHQYISYMINDHFHALDLTQDTFFRAYLNITSFHGEKPKAWLYCIARNLTIDYIRKENSKKLIIKKLIPNKITLRTPEQIATLNESEHELYVSLQKLKRNYRDVIILRKIQELSIEEAASILGWSKSKVKTNLQRGLQSLKKQMEEGGYLHETSGT